MTTATKRAKTQVISNGERGFFSSLSMYAGEGDGSYRSGKATIIDAGTDLDMFLEMSGADYRVDRVQATHPVTGEIVPSQFFLNRVPGNVVVAPKTVTESYGAISPTDLANSVRGLVDEGFLMASDFMLHAKEGITGMAETLAFRIRDDIRPTIGDESDWGWYLLLTNTHGRGKVRGRICAHRPVCTNQLTGVMRGFDWAISHGVTRNDQERTKRRLIEAAQNWESLGTRLEAVAERLNLFVVTPVSHAEAAVIVNDVIGIDQRAQESDISGNKRNRRDAILLEFSNETRGTFGRTAFDLYNATTAFTSHGNDLVKSTMDAASRANSILDGGLGTLETDMVDRLLAVATS